MSGSGVIVLKFGGSVLPDEASLAEVVHEIYRWRREGLHVVAVVSALAGTTDRLLAKAHALACGCERETLAALLSLGEYESAALLAAALDGAGVPATVLMPGALGLKADGPADDASPVGFDVEILLAALDRAGVVIVPGFIAHGEAGQPVVLGRGGSDLTAIAVAARLGARCRLVKDVDALYEDDPKKPGPKPRRFLNANYADELRLDPSVIQHKAVRFAQSLDLPFELSDLNGVHPTTISAAPTRYAQFPAGPPPLRVALLGFGTVGQSVYRHLVRLPDVVLTAIALRDPSRPRAVDPPRELITTDPVTAVSGADVVIEVMGGIDAAGEATIAALRAGAHVITANKALLAERWQPLHDLAAAFGSRIACSAAVGGALPILEMLRSRPADAIRSVRGILNGTTNFVLSRIAEGLPRVEAIALAQQLGFAEADPTGDLEGHDAACKLCVIAASLGSPLPVNEVARDPFAPKDITATAPGVIRQVASLDFSSGRPTARVRLERVLPDDPLSDVPNERNACTITWEDGVSTTLRGRGAGGRPTAESVIADLLELTRLHRLAPEAAHV